MNRSAVDNKTNEPPEHRRGGHRMPAASVPMKIDDVGEYVPYARKHLTKGSNDARIPSSSAGDEPRLADLFPEPNWAGLITEQRSVECVAYLAMLYDSIGRKPRPEGCFGLSGTQWKHGYVFAVKFLREFFDSVQTLEQAKAVARTLAARLGTTPTAIVKLPLAEVAAYWAASPGGKRTMRPLGSLTTRQAAFARCLHHLGWPRSDTALRANVVPVALQDGTWRVALIKGDGFYFKSEPVATVVEAAEICRGQIEQVMTAAAIVGRRRASLDQPRVGPDHRGGADISGEQLMKTFGLRSIQFGESVPQAERQAWLNQVYDAFADLSDVLALPREWVGLAGIAIAIGARGISSATAHYEPSLRVVNVTRMRGSGSIAHEWFHALDHRLGRHYKRTSLIEACFVTPDWYRDEGTHFAKAFVALGEFLRQSQLRIQAQRIELLPRARQYWTKPEELAARAFESWVEDRLGSAGRHSPCLVHGTLEQDHKEKPDLSPYPGASERAAIGTHFEQLAKMLRTPSRTAAAQQNTSKRLTAKTDYVRSQGQTRPHHCHWPGCDQQIPPAMWGCKAHWFALPENLRMRIWQSYSPGQEVAGTPSSKYIEAAKAVQTWINEQRTRSPHTTKLSQ